MALRWKPLRADPLVTSDYVLDVLPGANATAANIADDGYIVGSQNGAPASWSAAGTLSLLPTFNNCRGEPNDVRVIEGRHWIAGELALGPYWRASLWRVQ